MRRMTDGLKALAVSSVAAPRLTSVAANANGVGIGLGLGIPSAAALGTRQILPTHRAPA